MEKLSTKYLGLTLRSPLIVSSSRLTSTLGHLREAEDNGAGAVVLPELWAGKTVHVYAFFQNAEQEAACNSVYLGTMVVQ